MDFNVGDRVKCYYNGPGSPARRLSGTIAAGPIEAKYRGLAPVPVYLVEPYATAIGDDVETQAEVWYWRYILPDYAYECPSDAGHSPEPGRNPVCPMCSPDEFNNPTGDSP